MANARWFNDVIVEPTLKDFDAEYSSIRHAFFAVAVIDSLAAHIYAQAVESDVNPFELLGWYEDGNPEKSNDSVFRHRLAEIDTAFKIIRDVAKAFKHAVLTQHTPLVARSDQTVSIPKGYALGRIGEGRHGGVSQVILQMDNGEEIYLEHQVLEAHEFLKDILELLEQRLD